MKKSLFLLLPVVLLILTACESGASFKVINRSDYPLYVRIDNGSQVSIPGQGEHRWEISTRTQYPLTGEVQKKVKVEIEGETYRMFDEIEEIWLDETEIKLKAGESRKAYIWPNRASIKIVNQSTQAMQNAEIFKHNFITGTNIAILNELAPGDSTYHRVDFTGQGNVFYYYVKVQMADGEYSYYGGENVILEKDQQFLVRLCDD